MLANRSIADSILIPELGYDDIHAAAEWLERAFGFRKRLVIFDHRIQMTVGRGAAIALTDRPVRGSNVLVRVDDATAHHARAAAHGAKIVRGLADHPFGERQYSAEDPGGHVWTFSESIADVDPASWGGVLIP